MLDYKEDGSRGFYLFDQSGEILLEYEGTTKQKLVDPLRIPEGELILPVYDETEECYEFLWVDTAEEELLPGAMEIGTIGDRFLGMPMAVTAETLAVAADT